MTEVEEQCKNGNTNGKICNPLCMRKKDQVCVKMAYYLRSPDYPVTYYSSFCGEAIRTSNGKAVRDSCFKQRQVETGMDVEACFCTTDRCNAGDKSGGTLILMGIVVNLVRWF